MQWKKKRDNQLGDTRIVTKFLLIPRCIGGEWRWLQNASYNQEQMFVSETCFVIDGPMSQILKWVSTSWVI